jgi:hypothetical protein
LRNVCAHANATQKFFLSHAEPLGAKLRRRRGAATSKIFFSAETKIARAKCELRKIAQNSADALARRRAEIRPANIVRRTKFFRSTSFFCAAALHHDGDSAQ